MAATAQRLIVVLTLLAPCAACSESPSEPAATVPNTFLISGVVRDQIFSSQTGDVVPNATVAVVYADASQPAASTSTAADGSFRLSGIAPGKAVQVMVTKGGYQPTVRDLPALTANVALDIGLVPIQITVTGIVLDATNAAAVPGASVEILTGWHKGRTTLTDTSGRFNLGLAWGTFSVAISRINYETRTIQIETAVNASVEVALTSGERFARVTFAGDLCTEVTLPPYLACTAPKEQRHTVDVQRTGRMIMSTEYRYVGDYYPNSLSMEVRCGSFVTKPPWLVGSGPSKPVEILIDRPCNYEVHLFNFIADTKGGAQTTYRVIVDYPQ